jgi:hypothetical protein
VRYEDAIGQLDSSSGRYVGRDSIYVVGAHLTRRGGRKRFIVCAANLCAFPGVNLESVVYFRKVERSSAGGTSSRRNARLIELLIDKIGIAVAIAKDAAAVTPFALVKGLGGGLRFLEHDSAHGGMVDIAKRGESRLWVIAHDLRSHGGPSRRDLSAADAALVEPRSTSRR